MKKETHKGDLTITKENQNDYKNTTHITGNLFLEENATFTAPKLEKSGSVYVRENATFTALK